MSVRAVRFFRAREPSSSACSSTFRSSLGARYLAYSLAAPGTPPRSLYLSLSFSLAATRRLSTTALLIPSTTRLPPTHGYTRRCAFALLLSPFVLLQPYAGISIPPFRSHCLRRSAIAPSLSFFRAFSVRTVSLARHRSLCLALRLRPPPAKWKAHLLVSPLASTDRLVIANTPTTRSRRLSPSPLPPSGDLAIGSPCSTLISSLSSLALTTAYYRLLPLTLRSFPSIAPYRLSLSLFPLVAFARARALRFSVSLPPPFRSPRVLLYRRHEPSSRHLV